MRKSFWIYSICGGGPRNKTFTHKRESCGVEIILIHGKRRELILEKDQIKELIRDETYKVNFYIIRRKYL